MINVKAFAQLLIVQSSSYRRWRVRADATKTFMKGYCLQMLCHLTIRIINQKRFKKCLLPCGLSFYTELMQAVDLFKYQLIVERWMFSRISQMDISDVAERKANEIFDNQEKVVARTKLYLVDGKHSTQHLEAYRNIN